MVTRVRLIYCGNVQGVGFRYTARRVAHTYAVIGFVRNLTDGTVELVAEGEKPEVERFVEDVEQQMHGFIRSRRLVVEEPSGGMDGFGIRF